VVLKEMNSLEKFIFLQLTWKQFGNMNQSEYYKNVAELSEKEEELSVKIGSEIHRIYNYINSNFAEKPIVNSIQEYDEIVSPVSEIILKVSSDFGLTLKGEVSEEFKKGILNILGKDYLDDFLKSINH
jgi:hypothetical protein